MSTSPQTNPNDQEIDLGVLVKKIGSGIQAFIDWIFDWILFVKRNIIILLVLILIGIVGGYLIDKNNRIYEHQIIVSPNFGSTDYLYSKVELISSKIKEKDTVFFNSIGVKDPTKLFKIEIEPILDVYSLVNEKQQNFDLLKLMAEEGEIDKVVKNKIISKNYSRHLIKYKTEGKTKNDVTLDPLLKYLNQSVYFAHIQKEYINNIKLKIDANTAMINQINGILNTFSEASANNQKSDKLVYYNENSQLNDIIKNKDELIKEQGRLRIDLVSSDKIIKENSFILNIESKGILNGNIKLILPLVLLGLFFLFSIFRSFYRNQLAKRNLA